MAKIARAQIVSPAQLSLIESPEATLERVIHPGASTARYRRTWRIGLTTVSKEQQILYSRIGFEGSRTTVIWDDKSTDFLSAPVPSGQFAPFAIDLRTLSVAFQTRPPDIKVSSFTGALQGVLRDESGDPGWRVESQIRHLTFAEWRSTVDRVTRLHFRLERPNPNWEGRPDLEAIFQDLGGLDQADFEFLAETGIDTDAGLVREMLDHVEARKYGRGTAVGVKQVDGEPVISVMDTEHGEAEEWTRPDEASGEVQDDSLREELRRTDPG